MSIGAYVCSNLQLVRYGNKAWLLSLNSLLRRDSALKYYAPNKSGCL
ncbi:hypothetical protein MtrunA17_Chr4g0050771 [Medicago truncatula]|uniref:Uncharacterized protein n=1 Tax=Medicago truncatula TaxID=3880 RepID=A0A396ID71_MEDTR|nr:hypothetical protein MtrunA17_Chr4g0050771 [Medicago truncatula]